MKDIAMKFPIARVLFLSAALLASARPALVQAATPANGAGKLDRSLALIADAAANNRGDALMAEAISREMFRRNGPSEVRWNAAGQVQVYLRYDPNGRPPTSEELRQVGASNVLVSRELGVVQAWVPAAQLVNAAQLTGVRRVTMPRYAVVRRVSPLGALHYTGSVDTQGDSILGAAAFRTATGFSGAGSVVGVMSDGDTNASKDVATGDLPSNIWDDPKDAGGTGGFGMASSGDEGTAMLEIIYDLAPGVSQLGFCGPGTDVEFLTCLTDFVGSGGIKPTIIVDDLGFPGEPMFTDGDFGTGVQSFATANPSIRLVTAAGNDGNGFWSGQWNSSAAPPITTSFTIQNGSGITYTQALNFGTSTRPNPKLTFTVQGTAQVPTTGDSGNYIVQWNDPWDDKATTNINDDYDVVLFDANNHIVAYNQGTSICAPPVPASPANNIYCTVQTPPSGLTVSTSSPGPQPIQGSFSTNAASGPVNVHLEVFLNTSNSNNTMPGNNIKILVFSQHSFPVSLTPSTPGGIFGQAALPYPAEITVGAVPVSNGACDGVTPSNQIEPYSSEGPVVYGTTSGQTPGTRIKPDFVAPDGVSTTGIGGFGEPFCGTSAAAPHIAGLLALLGPAYPSQVPYSLLAKYAATPDGSAAPNGVFGYGLPSMTAMLNAGAFPPPTASISSPTAASSITAGSKLTFSGTCSANGASSVPTLDWNFGSGSGIADSSQTTTTATFSKAGAYTVTLSCTDSLGSNSASVAINVTAPPSSGGGGDLGLGELGGLFAALAVSRRRRQRR